MGAPINVYVVTINGELLYQYGYMGSPVGISSSARCDVASSYHGCVIDDGSRCIYGYAFLEYQLPLRFAYDQGPERVSCPGSDSEQCFLFFNSENGEFVIADTQNRVLKVNQAPEHGGLTNLTITYYDDLPSLDMFNITTDCDNNTLPDLTPYGAFYPSGVDCAYHITLFPPDGDPADIYVFKDGERIKYFKYNDSEDSQYIYRCENDDYDCYVEKYNGDECFESEFSWKDQVRSYLPKRFDYIGEPETVQCSADSTDECTKYTDIKGNYIIVDSQNRTASLSIYSLKRSDYTTYYYVYHDTPSVEIFDDLKCNDTALPPAIDPCVIDSSSSSSIKSSSSANSKASSSANSKASSSAKQSSSLVSSASLAHSMLCVVVFAIFIALL